MGRQFLSSLANVAPKESQKQLQFGGTVLIVTILLISNAALVIYKYSGWFNKSESEQYLSSQNEAGDSSLQKAKQAESLEEKLNHYKQAVSSLGSTGRTAEVVTELEELKNQLQKSDQQYPVLLDILASAYFADNDYDKAIATQSELTELYKEGRYGRMPYTRADAQDKLSFYKSQTEKPNLSIPDPSGVYDR